MNVSRSPVFSRLPTDAGQPEGGPVGPWLVPLVFVASALAHAGLYFSVSSIAERPQREKPPQIVRITDAKPPPPPPAPPPVLEEKKPEPPPPPKKEPPKERKPRVRQDERVKPPPPDAAPPPPEVRAGLSDSTALPGTGKPTGIAVAEGNSAELAVNPEDARKPPPPPAPPAPVEERYDPDAVVLTEAAVDTPSSCPSIGEVPLSEDAINAGVTSGKVVVEIVIASNGGVAEAKLLQGTGYAVDADVLARYKKLRCKPGTKNGAPARSRRKIELPIEL